MFIILDVNKRNGQFSVFILLGQSAAFDPVAHSLFLEHVLHLALRTLLSSSFLPTLLAAATVSFVTSFSSFLLFIF